jgi:hypothetical protein
MPGYCMRYVVHVENPERSELQGSQTRADTTATKLTGHGSAGGKICHGPATPSPKALLGFVMPGPVAPLD